MCKPTASIVVQPLGFQTETGREPRLFGVVAGCPLIYTVGAQACTFFFQLRFLELHGATMPEQSQEIQLSDEDVEFLVSLIRTSTAALTTDQLVEALRTRIQ